MAARDRYTSNIKCPNCDQIGIFHLSEDDHPYIRNPHREIDKIEGEFTATITNGIDVNVKCLKCGENFSH